MTVGLGDLRGLLQTMILCFHGELLQVCFCGGDLEVFQDGDCRGDLKLWCFHVVLTEEDC